MANFRVTNRFTGTTTLDPDDLDENFDDLEAALNGGLDETAFTSNTTFANAQLDNSVYEFVVNMTVTGEQMLNNTANDYIAFAGLPYDAADGATSYTLLAVETITASNSGNMSGGGTLTLDYGNFTDGWTAIKTGMTTGTVDGQARIAGFTSTATTSATRPMFFSLQLTTKATGTPDETDTYTVSIKLKRTAGLRA